MCQISVWGTRPHRLLHCTFPIYLNLFKSSVFYVASQFSLSGRVGPLHAIGVCPTAFTVRHLVPSLLCLTGPTVTLRGVYCPLITPGTWDSYMLPALSSLLYGPSRGPAVILRGWYMSGHHPRSCHESQQHSLLPPLSPSSSAHLLSSGAGADLAPPIARFAVVAQSAASHDHSPCDGRWHRLLI